ncbi:MAG: 30S ribosomal protein S3 [Candidatus Aenigmarchaeota archaeon]|nr:30S ribosomal protein S3 [Candidatus Aenigmarchaeota archaeon]
MLKQYFIKQGLKEAQIEEFIRKKFPEANYSHMELQRTPLGVKVVIHSSSPGRIIGRGGVVINELTQQLKEKFNLENPQVDVKSVPNPNLDAKIVAAQITQALARGFNFKRIGNIMLKKVMGAGAIGVEIVISGKITGGKGLQVKFLEGYLKHSGHLSKELVDYGYADIYQVGRSKPGKIGVKVKIMREFESITGERRTTIKEIPKPKPVPVAPPAEVVPQPEAAPDTGPVRPKRRKKEKV